MDTYTWIEVPEDLKDQLPPEFKNQSFRLLFEKALSAGVEVSKHFECGPAMRAVVLDLGGLLAAPGVCEDGPAVSELWELLQINNIDRSLYTGLIISAVDKDAMKALLEGGVPAHFVGVQNNTTCNPAFLQAAEELTLGPQPVEKSLRVKGEGGRADYKLYFVKNGYPAELLRDGQRASPPR